MYIYSLYIPLTEDPVFPFSFGKGSRAIFISHVSETKRLVKDVELTRLGTYTSVL
jgi:hypothetical protein